MPDLIIKPAAQSGNKVIIQDQAGGAVITTVDSGATIANATLNSPTLVTPALGTPASGVVTNLSGVLPSGVTGGSGLTAAPSPFTLSAAQSQTGGNAKAFTGIPSWHRHIYLFINGFSFNDGADILMQLGYGSTTYQSSGYTSTQTNAISSQSTTTSGFGINVGSAGRLCHGMSIFTRMNDTTYYWQCFMSAHSNVPTYAAGQSILSSGPATAIQIKGTTGIQDGGTVYAGWE